MKWRNHHNSTSSIEIRTTEVFSKAVQHMKIKPNDFWSFADYPKTLEFAKLEDYWKNNAYMDKMRILFS